jgi:tetratricopeptide (TPR) repeat protein
MITRSIARAATGSLLALVLAGGPATAAAAPAKSAKPKPAAKGSATHDQTASTDVAAAPESAPAAEAEPAPAEPTDGLPDGLVLDPAAADRANAEAAYREGSDFYEVGNYREAVERFQRAWELSKEEQLLYNLGQAYWKWFDVDPDVEHLRQAALFFRNYDKRMRLTEDYDPVEIDNILKAIDAQIEIEERKIADANRPVIVQPGGPTEEELAWQQRRRTTRGLNISGTTLIVVGGVTLGAGVAAVLSRAGHEFVLDSATPTPGGINLATPEEDARRRDGFLLSGQIAFGTLIAAAAILPVGITLRVIGAVRDKQDRAKARERDTERERNAKKAKVAWQPTLGGVRVRF